jgi:hypothetical protein
MSEKLQYVPQNNSTFKVFAGFQNYKRVEIEPRSLTVFWTYPIYATKLKFFITENEDEYRVYVHGNLWKTVVYSDWTQTIGLSTLFLNAPITLTSFFLANSLDIPRPFKRIRSLMQPTSSTVLAKLTAMLMRQGRKVYVNRVLTTSLVQLVHSSHFGDIFSYTRTHWRVLYQILTTIRFHLKTLYSASFTQSKVDYHIEWNEFNYQDSTTSVKSSSPINIFSHSFCSFLYTHTPLFSFLIKKVSKLQWKHSRGKSGRYSIKWKYIPIYKRVIVLLRWLVNDIQFQTHHNFKDRLYNSLKNLWFSPSAHLIIQFRQFVHKYVFQRCKNNLLRKLHSEV